jgi:hypothetical protein
VKDYKGTREAAHGSSGRLPEFSNGAEFDALSGEEKEKVARFYEQGKHRKEMRPLNAPNAPRSSGRKNGWAAEDRPWR